MSRVTKDPCSCSGIPCTYLLFQSFNRTLNLVQLRLCVIPGLRLRIQSRFQSMYFFAQFSLKVEAPSLNERRDYFALNQLTF